MRRNEQKEKFFQISEKMYEEAHASAYSIENMAAHGAESRSVKYIGSRLEKDHVFDYYKDALGAFWYRSRKIADGKAVSMELYIFGKEVKSKKYSRSKF